MDAASANGHLNVIKWLHLHHSASYTVAGMDGAAGNGRLDAVMWLHENCVWGARLKLWMTQRRMTI
ncbi:hypothetical protein PC116_g22606 [Phytophthora cactorum]|uniref:Uncharacterized protein n=1 Tax=Phytophthora cactorum TaxID=29920 RepID=A0A8T1JX48_9STRA|nr:hypothetical protein PC114_g19996 [Phytophthora cactorum]KAG2901709.1 hypothetical protein PC117_g21652 [Phytophthora cactorum]KAG2979569.1 hypothetical protein PC119_g21442 [Phytophthora cactorum]KAG3160916.1 hypothetical protein PC128_g20930 [Phytophthora cactorum]KAG4051465.1 hypothetical protein PC123_g13322 [Phytophthora cactorum]